MQTVLLVTLASCLSASVPEETIARDTVVVCPDTFLGALHPWLVHRTGQGHHFAYVSNEHTASEIRRQIRDVAREGNLRHIVLIGDADPAARQNPLLRRRSVPTGHFQARDNQRFGSEPQIASDNWYADLDDDQVPDVAIGRLTADSPEDLAVMVRKILAYEQAAAGGVWRRQVNLVAGMGGFGTLLDSVIETTAKKFITDCVPPAFRTTMTYGSWRSPYCPDPRRFRLTTLQRLNEGCLLWIYMGHGQRQHLDWLQVPGGALPILDCSDVARMHAQHGSPIAVFLSCYTAAYDQAEDCLAEEMLRHEGAPVAVLGGSRVTMPYGMTVLGTALADEFFHHRTQTLGEVVLHAKRSMVEDEARTTGRRLLDALARSFAPASFDLAAERTEHVLMYHLLGDPLLRLQYPGHVELKIDERVEAGTTLRVTGQSELDGICLVELICRRDRLTFDSAPRREFVRTHAALTALNQVYRKANDGRWTWKSAEVRGGRLQTELQVPSEARGPCHVRVFVQGPNGYAIGAADVNVWRPNIANNRTNVASRRTNVR